jgi:hypothetical protein
MLRTFGLRKRMKASVMRNASNYASIQQGGEHHTQNNTININPKFESKIQELLGLIEISSELNAYASHSSTQALKDTQEGTGKRSGPVFRRIFW